MIDTHAHLDAGSRTPDELVARAVAAGVTRIITVGTTVDGGGEALALSQRLDGVYAILGIHPHEAGRRADGDVATLRTLLEDPRAVGVGETGLDYFRDYASHDAQRRLFEELLDLAKETRKPVVIHTRAADDDTLAALRRFDGGVVLHCFSSPPLLSDALDRGWYVSFAGNVTYPKAQELRDAAARVPGDRILAETDCPYLAPQPVRGRENEPANVLHTVAALAHTRGEDVDELAAQIESNAAACFALQ